MLAALRSPAGVLEAAKLRKAKMAKRPGLLDVVLARGQPRRRDGAGRLGRVPAPGPQGRARHRGDHGRRGRRGGALASSVERSVKTSLSRSPPAPLTEASVSSRRVRGGLVRGFGWLERGACARSAGTRCEPGAPSRSATRPRSDSWKPLADADDGRSSVELALDGILDEIEASCPLAQSAGTTLLSGPLLAMASFGTPRGHSLRVGLRA